MSREEAAAKALNEGYSLKWAQQPWDELVKSTDRANQNRVKLDRAYASAALAAADAHDAANGVHRVTLDQATMERVVDALVMTRMGDYNIEMSEFRNAAWAVLAAVVKEGQ